MAQTYAELEREARLLSPDERAKLVDVLLESLRDADLAEVESAWAVEIERRVTAYEQGDSRLVPAEEEFDDLRPTNGGETSQEIVDRLT